MDTALVTEKAWDRSNVDTNKGAQSDKDEQLWLAEDG
jgi:hypothetical protein